MLYIIYSILINYYIICYNNNNNGFENKNILKNKVTQHIIEKFNNNYKQYNDNNICKKYWDDPFYCNEQEENERKIKEKLFHCGISPYHVKGYRCEFTNAILNQTTNQIIVSKNVLQEISEIKKENKLLFQFEENNNIIKNEDCSNLHC